jgi:hypothetical protein
MNKGKEEDELIRQAVSGRKKYIPKTNDWR